MHIFRWPVISLLLALLLGFFLMGNHLFRIPAQTGLTRSIAHMCDTFARIDHVHLSPVNASLSVHSLYIADPAQRTHPLMSARVVDIESDPLAFLDERVVLTAVQADTVSLRLYQTPQGLFTPLPHMAPRDIRMRAQNILTYAAEYANPLARIRHTDELISTVPGVPSLPQIERKTPRELRLDIPTHGPDFVIEKLLLTNVTATLIPLARGRIEPLTLHDAVIAAENISSDPYAHPYPIRWAARGWLDEAHKTLCAVSTHIAIEPGYTNITVSYILTNAPLATFLPYVISYVPWLDPEAISSGVITSHGTISIVNDRLVPGTLYCRIDNFTASLENMGAAPPWLRSLSLNNSTLEAELPLTPEPPYLHLEKLLDTRHLRGTFKDVELRIKLDDLGPQLQEMWRPPRR